MTSIRYAYARNSAVTSHFHSVTSSNLRKKREELQSNRAKNVECTINKRRKKFKTAPPPSLSPTPSTRCISTFEHGIAGTQELHIQRYALRRRVQHSQIVGHKSCTGIMQTILSLFSFINWRWQARARDRWIASSKENAVVARSSFFCTSNELWQGNDRMPRAAHNLRDRFRCALHYPLRVCDRNGDRVANERDDENKTTITKMPKNYYYYSVSSCSVVRCSQSRCMGLPAAVHFTEREKKMNISWRKRCFSSRHSMRRTRVCAHALATGAHPAHAHTQTCAFLSACVWEGKGTVARSHLKSVCVEQTIWTVPLVSRDK